MQPHRRWRGLIQSMPQEPDLYLAKQLAWARPNNKKYAVASSTYPEPDNLTAAAAFEKLPRDLVPKEGLIYKDVSTGLWVIVVAIKLIPLDQIQAWCDMMYGAGACALWYNPRAVAARKQLDWNEQEIDIRNHDKISHVDRLLEQGFKILEMPKLEILPTTTATGINVKYISKPVKKVTQWTKYKQSRNYADPDYKIKGEHGGCRPVMTPDGVYNSVTEAALAMKRSPSYVSVRIAKRIQGWRKLTRAEYELLTAK